MPRLRQEEEEKKKELNKLEKKMVNLLSDEKREDTKKQRDENGRKFSCVVNVAEKRDETDRFQLYLEANTIWKMILLICQKFR